MSQDKENQLNKLLTQLNKLNEKNRKLEKFIYDLDLAKSQDAVKEEMTFTMNGTKEDGDEVANQMKTLQDTFENSLTDEQLKVYNELKDYQLLATLSQQNAKK